MRVRRFRAGILARGVHTAAAGVGPLRLHRLTCQERPEAGLAEEHFDVLIVGAGLSGIGAACHLQHRLPGKSCAILEGREAIGGTWDLFRYPGIRSQLKHARQIQARRSTPYRAPRPEI